MLSSFQILINTTIGCVVFLVTNIALLYTSHLTVRRFLSKAPHSVRLISIGVIFYSIILLVFQALSPFHAISKTWIIFLCLILAVVSHLLWGKHRNFHAEIDPVVMWVKSGLASRWAALILICGFVVSLSFSRALLMPPLSWDSLTYHLTFASLWIKKGTLLFFMAPDQMMACGHFPINGEIFASWLILPFHNDLLVNLMNFPITFLGGVACYAIARELDLSRKESSWAPALLCFAPVIYAQITTQYVDNIVFAFGSATVLFTFRYLKHENFYDALMAAAAAGIILGTKYTSIPIVGFVTIAIALKMMCLNTIGFPKKIGSIVLVLIILCSIGGRQYIFNTIEAKNPLYPLSVNLFNHVIFEGYTPPEQNPTFPAIIAANAAIKQTNNLLLKKSRGFYKRVEMENYKVTYFSKPSPNLSAGPKFLLFLVLAIASLFFKPANVSRPAWFFLAGTWIITIVLFYKENVPKLDLAATRSISPAIVSSATTRFISLAIAIFTIQGLYVIIKICKRFGSLEFFFVALIAWDLLYARTDHFAHIKMYPLAILIAPLAFFLLKLMSRSLNDFALTKKLPNNSSEENTLKVLTLKSLAPKKLIACTLLFIVLVGSLCLLQTYRDKFRYDYYSKHIDYHRVTPIQKTFSEACKLLDNPNEKKTIALAMNWLPPVGTHWFYYPLLGKYLQNEIEYISAKHTNDTPTFINRGLLRGNNFSIWLNNLKKKNVEYIVVYDAKNFSEPVIELQWMQIHSDKFKRIYSKNKIAIFKYLGTDT